MRTPVFAASILLALVAASSPRAQATSIDARDLRLLHQAAARLGREAPGRVTHWLRSRQPVAWARVGRDGRTVDIRFRDGQEMLVLPAGQSSVPVSIPSSTGGLRPHARTLQTSGPRAAVLEPFATELGLGSSAGDPEVSDLQNSGFQADSVYDTSVTVSFMTSLSRYNVVYMHTHSGLSAGGDGVLATGELANGDPSVAPYLQDGSVVPVGVAGDNTHTYYALTARFFATHVSSFAQDSILFLNGCKLLPATTFWNTLAARGVGVMISWSEDATTQDDYLSAAAFYNFMGQGQSVAGSIQSTLAAGYGTSQYEGVTATLGFRGDGTITLSRAAHGQGSPPTSTPPPTATRTSTRTPVPPVPTLTATRVPSTATSVPVTPSPTPPITIPLTITGILKTVSPGHRQTITVQSATDARLILLATMPNGLEVSVPFTADTSGAAQASFVQPKNSILHNNRTAMVAVHLATHPTDHEVTRAYRVKFGKIDISIDRHQPLSAGERMVLWVHTRARAHVELTARAPKHAAVKSHSETGAHGWTKLAYTVPRDVQTGQHISFAAVARAGGKSYKTSSSVPVG